jgi:serine/threonine protein phosphatase PrpC
MPFISLLILIVIVVAVFAAGVGFQRLRSRQRLSARTPGPLALARKLDALREQAARVIAPRSLAPGQPPAEDLAGVPSARAAARGRELPATRLDRQAGQTLTLPATQTRTDDWPPGLTVTALAAGPAGAAQQDVYYVQRDLVALARGLTAIGSGQRAAALALSAIMTSRPGQAPDAEQALRDGTDAANRLVRSIAQREPRYSDMVATLDVVYVAFDGRKPQLHFAHVGTSTIWLQRAGSPAVVRLTEPHVVPGGPVLRAVGRAPETLVPDTGSEHIEVGDRIFLTTASHAFSFTEPQLNAAAGYHADRPLHDAIAALADVVQEAGVSDEIMIVGAEVARTGMFLP